MRSVLTVLCALSLFGCTKIVQIPTGPSDNTTTVTTPLVNQVQYRVSGNATSAKIRFSSTADGLTQTVSSLPFFTSFSSTDPNLFVSLEVTPISYPFTVTSPFMVAQIYVNGSLFREASSADFLLTTLSVFGTYRR